jgi:3-oxoacyl-[acyl-carrier-protein] synthase-3
MNISAVTGIKIEGICACVPGNVVDNRTAGQDLFGSSIEDLIKSTGIATRRVCTEDTTGFNLCQKAAEELLAGAVANPSEIGGVVYVTFTPDNPMPNNATYMQHVLNLPNDTPAFDINLACSGYPYGLWVAALMAKSLNKKILLLDGDKQSHITSPFDKATAMLFSDAGSATIVSPANEENVWQFTFETDGSKRQVLSIQDGGARSFFSQKSLDFNTFEDGSKRRNTDIFMDGLEVFKFVAQTVKANLQSFMANIEKTPADYDFLILHQANVYMMKQLCKKLGFGLDKMPITADKFGNSSSSTIPLTIASELQQAATEKDIALLMSGFGGGLSIGSASITLKQHAFLKVIEHE